MTPTIMRFGEYSIARQRLSGLNDAMPSLDDRKAFIRANTRVADAPGLPIRLWQADELTPIWTATEQDLARHAVAPPFWAFPWAGGQALARYILDHPETVRDKRVLDLASGSGLVAIAAAMSCALGVTANDIDSMCEAAIAVNAELNGVAISYLPGDLLDAELPDAGLADVDVILAADVFYEETAAQRFLAFLQRAHASGVSVIAGDPGRTYFPRRSFRQLAEYAVETSTEIENSPVKTARVWTL